MITDSGRIKSLKELLTRKVSEGREYSFDRFCREKNIYKGGKEYRANNVWVVCPFHEDYAPSLAMSEDKGVWHCFGCGKGGSYLDLVYCYETEVEGKQYSKAVFCNNFLANNPGLADELGFSKVTREETYSVKELKEFAPMRFKKKEPIRTYLSVQEELLKGEPSKEQIILFILMMQQGIAPEVLRRELQKGEEKSYSLEELETFS